MKENGGTKGWELCFVDIYAFKFTKQKQEASYDASESISLLQEIEHSFKETRDKQLQPNIRYEHLTFDYRIVA